MNLTVFVTFTAAACLLTHAQPQILKIGETYDETYIYTGRDLNDSKVYYASGDWGESTSWYDGYYDTY